MIFETLPRQKRLFNVNDKKDIAVYKSFLENKTWGIDCCPFSLEEPYMTIPDMIKDKLIYHYLKVNKE